MNSKTACKAKRETTNTRETHKAKSVSLRESRILRRVLNLFCASVLELCSMEVELFASVVALISLCSLAKRGIEFSSIVNFMIYSF